MFLCRFGWVWDEGAEGAECVIWVEIADLFSHLSFLGSVNVFSSALWPSLPWAMGLKSELIYWLSVMLRCVKQSGDLQGLGP